MTFSARLFQKQVDQHGKLFRVPAHAHLPSDPVALGGVPGVGLGTCQPASPGAAQGMGLKPGMGPAFAFANETNNSGPARASLSWPCSQDVTAEVPGHSPVPSTQAASLLPSLFPDPQSRLPNA